jgi:glycosyltransferase involved in cell wall biosynthesis
MKYCNIYLSLSERVIFDLVILEALACGMNVFTSNDGGNKEIINNSNGCLINSKNLEDVAEIIVNSKLDYREPAIDSVKKFSILSTVNNYFELYEN